MKNFVQSGDVITVAAPANVQSGDFVKIGSLFGFAQADAAIGEDVALATRGVFEAVVMNASAIATGAGVYVALDGALDAAADDGGDPAVAYEKIGVAVAVTEDLGGGAARVRVKIG